MWIVKNVLRGALYIDDLDVKIPPKDYFDLDQLGRQRVEQSEQIRLAFEEGYLQNIRRDDNGTAATPAFLEKLQSPEAAEAAGGKADIDRKFRELQQMITKGFNLSQIEMRLNSLQQEMHQNADHSEKLRGLISEIKTNVLTPLEERKDAVPNEKINELHRELQAIKTLLSARTYVGEGDERQETVQIKQQPKQSAQQTVIRMSAHPEAQQDKSESAPKNVKAEAGEDRFAELKMELLTDFRQLMAKMATHQADAGFGSTGASGVMSDTEMRARLELLQEKEEEVSQRHFNNLGRRVEGETNASAMADLLDDI